MPLQVAVQVWKTASLEEYFTTSVWDEFWAKVESLVPTVERPANRQYQRRPGGGRKPMPARQVFSAIVYLLRTACQWKALPREFGSASMAM